MGTIGGLGWAGAISRNFRTGFEGDNVLDVSSSFRCFRCFCCFCGYELKLEDITPNVNSNIPVYASCSICRSWTDLDGPLSDRPSLRKKHGMLYSNVPCNTERKRLCAACKSGITMI